MRTLLTCALLICASGLAPAQTSKAKRGAANAGPAPTMVAPRMLPAQATPAPACRAVTLQQVAVEFTVAKDGLPADVKVPQLPGTVRACVMEAVMSFRFAPGMNNGAPVATKMRVNLNIGQSRPQERPQQ